MSFGMHLVEQGCITVAQLVEALREQRRLTPAVYELAEREGLLTDAEIIRLFEEFSRTPDHSFAEVARENALLTLSEVEGLLRIQRLSRPRLGVILVRMGCISRHEAQHQLEQYQRGLNPDSSRWPVWSAG